MTASLITRSGMLLNRGAPITVEGKGMLLEFSDGISITLMLE